MPNSSSFKLGNKIVRDSACFARIIYGKEYGSSEVLSCRILVEKSKWSVPLNIIREYFNDLKSMGWDFTYRINRKKTEFCINVDNIKGTNNRVTFFMAVRFLWEGTYGNEYDKLRDQFFKVIPHYMAIKKLLPKEKSKLAMLCLACNAYLRGNNNYNPNHFFACTSGCKIRRDLTTIERFGTVNNYFTVPHRKLFIGGKLSLPENWTEENYKELFKDLKYEPISSN